MATYPDYSRFPGPGDLPGDSSHPNSPDYSEPAFCMDDAIRNVASLDGEAEELAAHLIEALPALRWIAQNVELPRIVGNHFASYRADFAALLARTESLHKAVDAELEALNGRAAA
ncbi:hypothetical protein [Pseudoxanthomonas koreensis]|uniref:hypothetical protein n=1 Tax=Pseudoxanthomonas koreensis TaxID=266061 RepID=UPI001391622B|nr:hypothetical protein [Pseudoxanthomonas koreensis]KAF1692685.1 hypothetical protein CSC64_06775 [Pseudoxanthomonas koreensis]